MKRLAAALALAIVFATGVATAPAAAAKPNAIDHVLIVSAPRLTWREVAEVRPPHLLALFRRSAVASMSHRTIGPTTTLGEGYATIGAGNRATVDELTAGLAFDAADDYEGANASSVYNRRSSEEAQGDVLVLGIGPTVRRNRRLLYGAHVGELGTALRRHGRSSAVVANADTDPYSALTPSGWYHREAALAVMDREGRVAHGIVSASVQQGDGAGVPTATPLVSEGVDYPYSKRQAPAVIDQVQVALASSDVVLFELSDLERADAYGDVSTPAARREAKRRALRDSDEVLGNLLGRVDLQHTLVMVVSPAAPRTAEQLGVLAISGPGVKPGLARSPTTRRAGYVTLPDVAPTVLHALDIGIPHAMTGTAIASSGGATPSLATARDLARDSELTMFRDKATGPVSVLFVVFQVLVYAACVIALAANWSPRARGAVAYAALMVLAMPLIGFLSGLVHFDALGIGGYIAGFFGVAAVLAAAAWRLGRRRRLVAPAALIGATALMLVVDVVMGGPLQLNTVFGYSPVVAGRFAGFGNLAYGLLAMSAITLATILFALRGSSRRAVALVLGVLAVALIVDGAPFWGSDVGGVLASGPAFVVVLAILGECRIGWRRVAAAVGGTALALIGFALVDLSRPADDRTHLGRLAAHPGDLGEVVQRKLESNIHILTSSIWTLIIPVALAFLLFLALRPPGLLQALQRDVPGLRACLVGGLLAGLLGFAVNDSGVAVPAMMLAVLLPYLSFLLTTSER
jgi:hypothetical protein